MASRVRRMVPPMMPTQEDHEAAARRIVEEWRLVHRFPIPAADDLRVRIAAALSEAVRDANEERYRALEVMAQYAAERTRTSEAVRVAVEKCAQIAVGGRFLLPDSPAAVFGAAGARLIRARSDAQATPAPEPAYPCADCGTPRTKAQGGRIFTVCDECWEKHYGQHATPWVGGTPPETGEKEKGR